ncbi:unnamed protein product [Prunus brigantina]
MHRFGRNLSPIIDCLEKDMLVWRINWRARQDEHGNIPDPKVAEKAKLIAEREHFLSQFSQFIPNFDPSMLKPRISQSPKNPMYDKASCSGGFRVLLFTLYSEISDMVSTLNDVLRPHIRSRRDPLRVK